MASRLDRTLLVSAGVHLALAGVMLALPAVRTAAAPPRVVVHTVEMDLVERPHETSPEATPTVEPAPERAPRETPRPGVHTAPAARVATSPSPGPRATGEGPAPAPTVPPPSPPGGGASGTTGGTGPAPRLNGAEILRSTSGDAMRAVADGTIAFGALGNGHAPRDIVNRPAGTPDERARDASAGYVARAVAAGTRRHEAPGVRGYFWYLRRRMEEYWRPAVNNTPTLVDAVTSAVVMSPEQIREVHQSAFGAAVAPGRAGGAADTLDAVHGVTSGNYAASPTVAPFTGIVDGSRGNVRRTRAEIEVVQDADGNVTSIRVVRRSRVAGFDDAALRAVRDALPQQPPVAMPGGRRSRWSFEVVASRDPIMPGVGLEFDESTGWFELHWPGRLHVRTRVHLESAAPLGT